MGFADRLRAWFKGDSKRRTPNKSTDSSSRSATKELEEFVHSRTGVEGFLEPKTAIYSTTLLLVADDGEYLRRPIKSREQAGDFCGRINIPLYDAAKVGYPRRMRDYEQGRSPRKVELSELPPWPGDDLADGSTTDGPPPPPSERHVEPDPAADEPDLAGWPDASEQADLPEWRDTADEPGQAETTDDEPPHEDGPDGSSLPRDDDDDPDGGTRS